MGNEQSASITPLIEVYSGNIPDIVSESKTGISEDRIEQLWKEVASNGVLVTRHINFPSRVGVNKEGKVHANLRPGVQPHDRLHELVHVQQFLEAIASGTHPKYFSDMEDIDPISSALAEIQASEVEIEWLRQHPTPQNHPFLLIAQTHRSFWLGELLKLRVKPPEPITNPLDPKLAANLKEATSKEVRKNRTLEYNIFGGLILGKCLV